MLPPPSPPPPPKKKKQHQLTLNVNVKRKEKVDLEILGKNSEKYEIKLSASDKRVITLLPDKV